MSQPQVAIEESVARPLTTLSEDEQMFRDSVREFAEGEIRKRVEEMDEQSRLDPALIKQCFELGLMGIETYSSTCRTLWSITPWLAGAARIKKRNTCQHWRPRKSALMP